MKKHHIKSYIGNNGRKTHFGDGNASQQSRFRLPITFVAKDIPTATIRKQNSNSNISETNIETKSSQGEGRTLARTMGAIK